MPIPSLTSSTTKSGSRIFFPFLILLIVLYPLHVQIVEADVTTPTLTLTIHRIHIRDLIEGIGEGMPDWHYYIWVWNGEEWLSADEKTESGDDVQPDDIHSFTVNTAVVTIQIALLEDDTFSAADVADISGFSGGGYDNYDGTLPRGTYYLGTYDLRTNVLAGDYCVTEEEYYKTSGDYDGSTAIDENDAELWFRVWDNYGSPVANAGPNEFALPNEKVNFDGSGSRASAGSTIVRYEWDFESDGVIDVEGQKSSHTYTQIGEYTVTLSVTDSIGVTDTDTCTIAVGTIGLPVADAGSDQTVFVGQRVDFDGSRSTPPSGSSLERFQWDFQNDGVFDAEGEHVSYTYTSAGTYIVLLRVTDTFDQTDTDTCTVEVSPRPPSASFTYSPATPSILDSIHFYDTSQDLDGTIVSWHWNFGDGQTSTLKDATHQYDDKGLYPVTLTVTDNDGIPDSITDVIEIINLSPMADFTFSPTYPKQEEAVQFTDASTDPEEKPLVYVWDFGDGYTSTQQNPSHHYTASGSMVVSLTVEDDENASDSTTKPIEVIAVYDVSVEVRDLLGFPVSNAEVSIYSGAHLCDTGLTDSQGIVSLSAIPEGSCQIRVSSVGQTSSMTVSLLESETVYFKVPLSIYTMITVAVLTIAIIAVIFYAIRRRKREVITGSSEPGGDKGPS